MCFRSPPPPPPLPDPEPVAPKAEKTAEQVVTGNQRDIAKKGRKAATTTTRAAARKGTASLRIPLLTNAQTQSGNLRTPV
tara:strand:- start:71 stop:310 length:240 start_codon:yes stop_codon:yes gene_type:complete